MLFVGIDAGSVSTDVVIISEIGKIVGIAIVRTGTAFDDAARRGVCEAMGHCGRRPEEVVATIATGYGRSKVTGAQGAATEIRCHAIGARHLTPEVRTVIDVGGQDCKIIGLDESGAVVDFVMNDKCSAGTGRFIEAMARALDLDLEAMGPMAIRATSGCTISSTCTVFAETEIVSRLADGTPRESIVRGLHETIASKLSRMAGKLHANGPFGLTGGVGRNAGIVSALKRLLSAEVLTYQDPDAVGALGAALEARRIFGGTRTLNAAARSEELWKSARSMSKV